MKVIIERLDEFVYDLQCLSNNAKRLCNDIRDMKVVITTQEKRLADKPNFEFFAGKERAECIGNVKESLRHVNVCLTSLGMGNIEFDIIALRDKYINEQEK